MTPVSVSKTAFSFALIATMAFGMMHFTAEPAQALNCSFYSRPGCDFSHVQDVSPTEAPNTTFCCVFEGPNCCTVPGPACNGDTRIAPCWLALPPPE